MAESNGRPPVKYPAGTVDRRKAAPVTKPVTHSVTNPVARTATPRTIYAGGLTKTQAKADRMLNPLEEVEQKLFFRGVQGMAYSNPDLMFLFHVPNENKSGNRFIGIQLKKQGVRSGVPDNLFLLPKGGWAGWAGELKRNIGDGPSPEQWEYLKWLRAHGYYANWHRGHTALMADLVAYLALPFPKGIRPAQPPLLIEPLCIPPWLKDESAKQESAKQESAKAESVKQERQKPCVE